VNLSAAFTDAGVLDVHSATIDWGDGTTSAATIDEADGAGTAAASHAYAQGGIYTATITLLDGDGGAAVATVSIYVVGARISNGVLQIVGTGGNDFATVSPALEYDTGRRQEDEQRNAIQWATDGRLWVFASFLPGGVQEFAAGAATSVLMLLGAGNDAGIIIGPVDLPATLDGGAGSDLLRGGHGANTLLGGDGNDILSGGPGSDLMIGGRGGDRLMGNGGDDILVAGTTLYDTNAAALAAVSDAWGQDLPFADRVALLGAGVGPGGAVRLDATTVFDDADSDVLTGNAGSDWFFSAGPTGQTRITDLLAGDRSTGVGVSSK
jgi:Ca2+-binding RTX toxin-like protein